MLDRQTGGRPDGIYGLSKNVDFGTILYSLLLEDVVVARFWSV